MALNYNGGTVSMTGSWRQIDPGPTQPTRQFNVRSASSNSVIYLSPDGVRESGFMSASEARQFLNTPVEAVWFKGTAGDTLYWDVSY